MGLRMLYRCSNQGCERPEASRVRYSERKLSISLRLIDDDLESDV